MLCLPSSVEINQIWLLKLYVEYFVLENNEFFFLECDYGICPRRCKSNPDLFTRISPGKRRIARSTRGGAQRKREEKRGKRRITQKKREGTRGKTSKT